MNKTQFVPKAPLPGSCSSQWRSPAFANDYTAADAEQIFPKADSQGISVLVERGTAKADIAICPMKSIWNTN